jgi:hypothetical protein
MTSAASERSRKISETITHCAIALALIMGGAAGIEEAGMVTAVSVLFILAGTAVLGTTLMRHRLEGWVRNYDALTQVVDGLGVLVGAWLAHTRGSVRLPPILVVVGLLLCCLGIIRWSTPKGREREMLPKLERLALVACVAAITWVLACDVAGYGDFWMNATVLPVFGGGLIALVVWRLKRRAAVVAGSTEEPQAEAIE